ncbi:MAG: HAD family hydrolase [Anaerococcus vaginalis]|nr:HAD family hydrolase [Anaerococcus vaginalis]
MKLLFDCDGTILDSMYIWFEPINRLLDEYNYKLTTKDKGEIEALAFSDTIKWLNKNVCTDKSEEEVLNYFSKTIYDAYKNYLLPKKGAGEILKKLKNDGYDMCICSSTDKFHLKNALKRLSLFDLFDFILTPDKFPYKKSEDEYWQKALDNYKVDAKDAVLFDDALYAIKAAKKVGIKTVGIKDFPYNEKEWEEIKKQADLVIDNIKDIDMEKIKNL